MPCLRYTFTGLAFLLLTLSILVAWVILPLSAAEALSRAT